MLTIQIWNILIKLHTNPPPPPKVYPSTPPPTPLHLPQFFATPPPLHGGGVEFRYSSVQHY